MKTLLWEYIEPLRLLILVHDDVAPADVDWDAYVTKVHALHGVGQLERIFVFGDGPGPDARQRKKLHYGKGTVVHIAVLTHSTFARGIVTAMSWFYPIRAFAPADLDAAFRYLTLPETDWAPVRGRIAALRVQLSVPGEDARTPELADTIGMLDEIITDRLPRLRERLRNLQAKSSGGSAK